MEKATEIFEKHWTKATGKKLDETTKHHMKYAIEAINEALLLGAVSGRSEQLKCEHEPVSLEGKYTNCKHCTTILQLKP